MQSATALRSRSPERPSPSYTGQASPLTTLAIVFGLALVQMVVHFRFFLHVSLRKSAREDLQLILFSTLIVILMVSGTLVILFNLRERMM